MLASIIASMLTNMPFSPKSLIKSITVLMEEGFTNDREIDQCITRVELVYTYLFQGALLSLVLYS